MVVAVPFVLIGALVSAAVAVYVPDSGVRAPRAPARRAPGARRGGGRARVPGVRVRVGAGGAATAAARPAPGGGGHLHARRADTSTRWFIDLDLGGLSAAGARALEMTIAGTQRAGAPARGGGGPRRGPGRSEPRWCGPTPARGLASRLREHPARPAPARSPSHVAGDFVFMGALPRARAPRVSAAAADGSCPRACSRASAGSARLAAHPDPDGAAGLRALAVLGGGRLRRDLVHRVPAVGAQLGVPRPWDRSLDVEARGALRAPTFRRGFVVALLWLAGLPLTRRRIAPLRRGVRMTLDASRDRPAGRAARPGALS